MGGTFDPIHMGHLITAEMVRCAAFLDRILFVPSARPPHKDGTRTASPEDRLIMTEYAVRENLHFSVSDIELHRNGPSYTVDTIAELQSRLDGADLFFITGADAMNDLYLWHEPKRLLRSCRLIVATREFRSMSFYLRKNLQKKNAVTFRYCQHRIWRSHRVRFVRGFSRDFP